MQIAMAQVTSSRELADNLAVIDRYAQRAAGSGAELVVFPEAMMRAFGNRLTDIAEPLDGPWASQVHAIADRYQLPIVAGMFTPADAGRVRNTVLIAGPGVEEHYDKIHLFDAYGFSESDTVAAGDRPVVFDYAGVRFGLATCYDIRFPALFSVLTKLGAQAILVPASWAAGPGKAESFELLARARAMDSTCYVLACDQAKPDTDRGRAPTGVGHSIAVAPDGSVLASAGDAPQLIGVDIDPATVAEVRRRLPVVANAVPERQLLTELPSAG